MNLIYPPAKLCNASPIYCRSALSNLACLTLLAFFGITQLERCSVLGANRVQQAHWTLILLMRVFEGIFFSVHGTHSVSAVAGEINFYSLGNENARREVFLLRKLQHINSYLLALSWSM